MARTRTRFVAGLVVVLLAASQFAGAAPGWAGGGDPDLSFGTGADGSGVGYIGAGPDGHRRVFADPDGYGLAAFSGSLIPFDASGQFGASPATGIDWLTDAAPDPQGGTLLLGKDNGGSLRVERIVDNALDTSFGGGTGWVTLPLAFPGSLIAAAADGSIAVFAGGKITKLTPTGALDTTWNPSGATPGVAQANAIMAMAFQSSGALVYVCYTSSGNDPCLGRYTPDGQPDSAFGSGGLGQRPAIDASHQLAYRSLAVGPDDAIYAGGADMTDAHPMVAAYTPGGITDDWWNGTGVAVQTDEASIVEALLITSQGGVFAASGGVAQNGKAYLDEYTQYGQRYCGFARCGVTTTPVPPSLAGDQINIDGLALAPDGALLVAENANYTEGWISKITTGGIAAPTSVTATPTSAGIVVHWTNPASVSFAGTEVRTVAGVMPAVPLVGWDFVYGGTGSSVTVPAPPGSDRSIAVYASDYAATWSDPVYLTFRATHFAALPATTTIGYAASRTLTAVLVRSTGSHLPGAAVSVYTRRHGTSTWAKKAQIVTNSTGAVSYRLTSATVNTDVQFRFGGAHSDLATTATAVVDVAPLVTAAWSRTTVPVGTPVTVSGKVTPNEHGQYVYLQRLDGSTWRNVARAALSTTSTYAISTRPGTKGRFIYRLYRPADAARIAGTSSRTVITVA